ncbi:MAG: hypothetical protein Q7R87_00560, partial [Nanoarchaeota archaeon]|nr:hypothetical protein [Nanoarchaeota archaeon]
ISQYYNLDINVSATANGTTQTRTISVPFSSSRTAQFNFTLPAGNHTLSVSATTNNDLCVNTLPTTNQISNFTITSILPIDTTPPSQVSSLQVTNRSTTAITWNWTNPSNSDFNSSLIFLNGVNVLNTSAQSYTASNLSANTLYTLSIQTKDNSGNINTTAVTNSISTLASNTTGDPNGIPFIFIFSPLNNTSYNTTSIPLNVSSPNATSINYTINGNNFTYTSPVTLSNLINGTNTLTVRASNLNSTRTSVITFNVNTTSNSGGNGGGNDDDDDDNKDNQPTTNNKKFPDLTPQDKKAPVDYTEYEDTTSNNVANKKGNSINLIWILPTTLLLLIILLCLLLFVLLYKKK